MLMKKKLLPDVVAIRLLLIVLLVMEHSFAVYSGAWSLPQGLHEVEAYWWIGWTAYSFMLEAFIFISGYIFGYQIRTRDGGRIDLQTGVVKKAKRLMIPSILFSILYYLMFKFQPGFSWDLVLDILKGMGHLWFLPVLFLCFVLVYILEKLRLPHGVVLGLAVISGVVFPKIPWYYFMFFYVGYVVQRDDISLKKLYDKKPIAVLSILYLAVFITSKLFLNDVPNHSWLEYAARIANVVYASAGLLAVFALFNYLIERGAMRLSDRAVKLSGYCFGVYIFHQFLILLIVENPFMIGLWGTYVLPWVAFAASLAGSMLLTGLMLKTKVGRFLIG